MPVEPHDFEGGREERVGRQIEGALDGIEAHQQRLAAEQAQRSGTIRKLLMILGLLVSAAGIGGGAVVSYQYENDLRAGKVKPCEDGAMNNPTCGFGALLKDKYGIDF